MIHFGLRRPSPRSAETPADSRAQPSSHGVAVFTPDGSSQRGPQVPSPKRDIESPTEIERVDVRRLIMMAPLVVGDMGKVTYLKVLRDIEPSLGELRIRQSPQRKIPRYEVSSLQVYVASIRPNPGYHSNDAVGIGCLVVGIPQPALRVTSDGKAQIQLWLMSPHGRMGIEDVIAAGNDNGNEWSQDHRPLAHVVLHTNPEVLCPTMIIAIVNGNLVRIRAVVLRRYNGKAETGAEPVGNAVIDRLNESHRSNVPDIDASAAGEEMVLDEHILESQ